MKIDTEILKSIVGKENVSDNLADLYVYSSDASVHQALPTVVVRPKTIEEVQRIMKFVALPVHPTITACGMLRWALSKANLTFFFVV